MSWSGGVKHRVAVRANRSQVPDAIGLRCSIYEGKIDEMVNVNEAFSNISVEVSETEITNNTGRAVVLDAFSSGWSASLVGIDRNMFHGPFWMAGGGFDFISEGLPGPTQQLLQRTPMIGLHPEVRCVRELDDCELPEQGVSQKFCLEHRGIKQVVKSESDGRLCSGVRVDLIPG